MKRKILIILLVFISAFCFALGLSACGGSTNNSAGTNNSGNTNSGSNGGGNEQPSNVAVTGVSLNKTVLSLEVGDSETLIATVSPSNATNKTVTWESSNTTIAIVSNGKVTAVKAGSATIVATAGSKIAMCSVTVTEKDNTVAVTGVSLNKTTLTLEVGDSETLSATVSPSNATDKTVTWESSDITIATVLNGTVTAKKAGTATITATVDDKSASCEVTVTEKVEIHTHNTTLVPAKSEDCESDGNLEYYTCSCGKWFKDKNATVEVTDKNSVIIKATGHSFSSEWTTNGIQHWHVATCKHTDLKDATENHTFENSVCTVCDYEKVFLIFNTLEVDDEIVYGKVSNATTEFSFIKEITAETNVTFIVCTDKACTNDVRSKTVDLEIGDNVFYVLAESGNDIKLYTVTIRRRPVYTITYNTNGGTKIESQDIEEDETIAEPFVEKRGYTLVGWTVNVEVFSFPYVVSESITVKSNYIANSYVVTLNVNGGNDLASIKESVTYDSKFVFSIPNRLGYSFLGWYFGEIQLTDAKGNSLSTWNLIDDITATAKWSINSYKLGYGRNISSAGEINEVGTSIEFGSTITLTAKTYLGYIWQGWFSGDEKLTEELNYSFKMPAKDLSFTATWEMDERLADYKFESTEDTCTIFNAKSKNITEVYLPYYVTTIRDGAFQGCSKLASVIFEANSNLRTIEYKAFYCCENLNSFEIPSGVTSIGREAFNGCINLQTVYWNAVTCAETPGTISPFYGCSALKTVVIGANVQTIPAHAFHDCTSLESITIGKGITSIGEMAFRNCTDLIEVHITDIANWCSITFCGLLSNPLYYAKLYLNNQLVTKLIIPDSVTSISDSAFEYCQSLESVEISESVISIGSFAFRNCSNLMGVTIGNSVTFIGRDAFRGCTGLKSVKIPDSVTYIGIYAFGACNGLESVTIGNGVTSIGEYAFLGCSGLTSVTIGNNVNSIESGVFKECTSLANITLPNRLTIIGYSAFYKCKSLKSINIDGNVKSIGDLAFYGCTGLENVTIGNSVTHIGNSAFLSCTSLAKVFFENSEGWFIYTSSSGLSVAAITGLEDSSMAAEYLTNTYEDYYWKRS